MEYRILGKTGLRVSALGFGCGGVGGLLIAGDDALMRRAVQAAVEAGINYFDTAQLYGDGRSEENLGRVLSDLRPDVIVGTKVHLTTEEMDQIENKIVQAAETSLRRLRKECLDLFQLHNPLSLERQPRKRWVGLRDFPAVTAAFHRLQASGKIRFWGINGIGETEAIHHALAASGADTIQVCYNLLNPSAYEAVPATFPFQNYQALMKAARQRQMGVIAFRLMAGGALTGSPARHPLAAPSVDPIASSAEYASDVALAAQFQGLVSGHWVENMPEAAIRFGLSRPEISTLLVGFSGLDQLEQAVKAVEKGPLEQEALNLLPGIWNGL